MKMLVTYLILCFAVSAYGASIPHIVGGTDAPAGKYPYQVSLRTAGRHFCGASIIDKRYVMTAAHCVIYESAGRVKVHVGTNLLNENGVVYDAVKIIPHIGYDSSRFLNDIALVRVGRDIEFNDLVKPISLASTNFATEGDVAVATGWGRLSMGGAVPNNLQEIQLKIESQERCANVFSVVKDSHICTFTKRGEGACHGDSGGPLVVNGIQVGIVSFGRPCAVGSPDVYTRVFSFREWINQNMN